MWVEFNSNPSGKSVGDCAVRAISKATGQTWTDAYIALCSEGLAFRDMPSSNYVWRVMNDMMKAVRVAQPKLYEETLKKISSI